MRSFYLVLVMALMIPSGARAENDGFNWMFWKKKQSAFADPNKAKDPAASWYKDKTSLWKQRFDARRSRQWAKPAGENFPKPKPPPQQIVVYQHRPSAFSLANFFSWLHWKKKNAEQLKKLKEQQEKEQERLQDSQRKQQKFALLFDVLKKLKHLALLADKANPFPENAGFGQNVERVGPQIQATSTVRTRFDLHRRHLPHRERDRRHIQRDIGPNRRFVPIF